MRHARSGWPQPGEHDFDRTLDDQGFAEAEMIAQRAADQNYAPDLILCSTAIRCQQTAQALQRAFGIETETLFVDELYNAPVENYLALIAAQTVGSLMLVGHNPAMEALLEAFLGADRASATIPTGYPTAGLAVLDHDGGSMVSSASWKLKDFLHP